jgi:hypothetical protein
LKTLVGSGIFPGSDTVKKRSPKKKLPHALPLNLSGIKFEDAMRRLANAPPLPKEPKKQSS